MKKINILYWTFTGLLALLMLFSGIQNAMVTQPSIDLLTTKLGYPEYIIAFLGVAKVLGAIAIIIPGFPRVKEWAYAGMFFDLLGATYSALMVEGLVPGIAGMLIFFALLGLSYGFYHTRKDLLESARAKVPAAAAVA